MRIVVDTNVVVSGLIWGGKALEILKAGTAGTVDLFTRAALLAELEEVLGRRKFLKYLAADQTSARQLVIQYANLATIVQPARIPPVVLTDPDDGCRDRLRGRGGRRNCLRRPRSVESQTIPRG